VLNPLEDRVQSTSPHETDLLSNGPSPGDRIRIRSGILVGQEGTVTGRPNPNRVQISLDALEAGIMVEVDQDVVEGVS